MLSWSLIENKYIVSDWETFDNYTLIRRANLTPNEFVELADSHNGKVFDKKIEFKNKKDAKNFIEHIDNIMYANR